MVNRATSMKQEEKKLKIFTLDPDRMYLSYFAPWTSVSLDHPSTFETLAMDPDVKRSVMDDLDQFVQRRDFYKRVGKAW
ncbi:unnamed protein product [Arabis nemorensis]|uniref:Uncharacterized protein n=1 Tax=Arabis nemorensis TaxID=586526 RepID=A0A565BJX9_9BRAS|nr:unnamed protein product [Arabis nemorensis]